MKRQATCSLAATVLLILLGAMIAPADDYVFSPPLRYRGDTRSAFSWQPGPAASPHTATVRFRVIGQHRDRPNPWEVAWVVIGNERRFVAFIPKPNGWELSLFDADAFPQQTFLASGRQQLFPVGDLITVTMMVSERGVGVVCGDLVIARGWSRETPRPSWLLAPARAGVYVEDCVAALQWQADDTGR